MAEITIVALVACIFGLPAILGVSVARLWYGTLDKYSDLANPIGIAAGLSFVIAGCLITALSPEVENLEKLFGPWIRYLGVFSSGTFVMGLMIGWAENRNG